MDSEEAVLQMELGVMRFCVYLDQTPTQSTWFTEEKMQPLA